MRRLAVPNLLRLIYRNFRVNTDPASLIILLGLPAMYLVFFGFGFGSLAGAGSTAYLAFLAPGIMAFQSIMAGTVGGSMLWADRRYGMLAQLLVGPFSRLEYLFGIMLTALLFGLGGAAIMLAISVVLVAPAGLTLAGALGAFGAIALGSIFFGSLMLLISALVKSNNAYNSIQVLVIFFVNFASTVFYPYSTSLPAGIRGLFLANPLTYVADTARSGLGGTLSAHNGLEMVVLAVETIVLLMLATRAYMRADVTSE
ncbi:MAG: ABC transporter permease [Thermoplasmata archaeon]